MATRLSAIQYLSGICFALLNYQTNCYHNGLGRSNAEEASQIRAVFKNGYDKTINQFIKENGFVSVKDLSQLSKEELVIFGFYHHKTVDEKVFMMLPLWVRDILDPNDTVLCIFDQEYKVKEMELDTLSGCLGYGFYLAKLSNQL